MWTENVKIVRNCVNSMKRKYTTFKGYWACKTCSLIEWGFFLVIAKLKRWQKLACCNRNICLGKSTGANYRIWTEYTVQTKSDLVLITRHSSELTHKTIGIYFFGFVYHVWTFDNLTVIWSITMSYNTHTTFKPLMQLNGVKIVWLCDDDV